METKTFILQQLVEKSLLRGCEVGVPVDPIASEDTLEVVWKHAYELTPNDYRKINAYFGMQKLREDIRNIPWKVAQNKMDMSAENQAYEYFIIENAYSNQPDIVTNDHGFILNFSSYEAADAYAEKYEIEDFAICDFILRT